MFVYRYFVPRETILLVTVVVVFSMIFVFYKLIKLSALKLFVPRETICIKIQFIAILIYLIMKLEKKDLLSLEEKIQLHQLWNTEYPEQLKHESLDELDLYLKSLSSVKHYLLIDDAIIKAWAFSFIRDNAIWFAIIVSHETQRMNKGLLLLNLLKKENNNLNGWVVDHNNYKKENGQVYISPILFYKKMDFTINTETRLENEKLSAVKIRWECC